MPKRCPRLVAILAMIPFLGAVQGQVQKSGKTPVSTKAWTPPRTADGQPDLQGTWTNATLTPFERSAQFAGKATITDQEAEAMEKRARENTQDRTPRAGDTGSYNQAFFDSGSTWLSTRQSSLVVEPSNGKVPVKPTAEAQRDYDFAHLDDSPKHHTSWERCITRGVRLACFRQATTTLIKSCRRRVTW